MMKNMQKGAGAVLLLIYTKPRNLLKRGEKAEASDLRREIIIVTTKKMGE
jgi:hypothetical protein